MEPNPVPGPPCEGPIPIPGSCEATAPIIHQWASALCRSKLGQPAAASPEGGGNGGQLAGGLWGIHSRTSILQVLVPPVCSFHVPGAYE